MIFPLPAKFNYITVIYFPSVVEHNNHTAYDLAFIREVIKISK